MNNDSGVDPEHLKSLLHKYPGRVPVRFVAKDGKRFGEAPQKKFLIPYNMSMGEVSAILHQHLSRFSNISSTETVYLCTDMHVVPKSSATIGSLYGESQPTGLATIFYCTENTLG